MADDHDINQIIEAYRALPKNLEAYLPQAKPVKIERTFAGTCDTMTVLLDTIKQFFGDEAVSGWLTLQSSNLLLENESQWLSKLTIKEPVLQAELAAGEQCITIHYENRKWHLALISVAESQQANALAIPHSFAIDTLRSPSTTSPETLHQITYWVVWQKQPNPIDSEQQQLVPVAQCLRGIEDTGQRLHEKEATADV